MNRFTTWLHTRTFLADMITRYAADNHNLGDENAELRKKIAHKDDLLERALADHRQSNSFNQAVITGMQKQIKELNKQLKDVYQECDWGKPPRDIDPETEQDYIDQVIQDQADRAPVYSCVDTGYNPF